uniref:Uncharacterized protein n=1 Tax=Anguilla anguilla TaxID=7936 RepID=A0A0E9TCF2_ANGAN
MYLSFIILLTLIFQAIFSISSSRFGDIIILKLKFLVNQSVC